MKKETVFKFYGGRKSAVPQLCKILNLSKMAIYNWGEIVPIRCALKLNVITKGKLKVDAKDYVFDGELTPKTQKFTYKR